MRPLFILLLFALPAALAAPVPKALTKKPPQSLDGYWYLTESIEDGVPVQMGNSYCRHTLIRGERYASSMQGRPTESGGEDFTLIDPDRPQLRRWQGRPAVFEADGDTLRGCFATDGRKELTECKPGKGVIYYVFERVKEK
jgi:hypothetical protein